MTHFHVVAAGNTSVSIASVRYENYEDSLKSWVNLSNMLFKNIEDDLGGLAIENARLATQNGEGKMARVGTNSLCFYWMRCEDECFSITWN